MFHIASKLQSAGIPISGQVVADGKIHRYKTEGDHEANCWYVLHENGDLQCGAYGCWKRQISEKYCNKYDEELTPEERKARSAATESSRKERLKQEQENQAEVRTKASRLFTTAPHVSAHGYLTRKGVGVHGLVRISNYGPTEGWLALALQDERDTIHSAQFISQDGTKRFYYQGRVNGCFFKLSQSDSGPIIICEGYATGASVYEATGWHTVCAMNCGNLMAVGTALRRKFPERTIVISADNDQFTEDNPGLTKARDVSEKIGAIVAFPEFGDESLESGPTDFNDLHRISGLDEVRRQIHSAFPLHARPIGLFERPKEDDDLELLRHRYLCQRGGLLIQGPTGLGKSSLMMQFFALWSNGLPAFGIVPVRPFTCVLIQAENDEGDMAEMRDGICAGLNFTQEQRKRFFSNVLVLESAGVSGRKFCTEVVAKVLDLHDPDMLGIDPALSYIGGDVKEQKIVGEWLRVYLNPILFTHGCGCVLLHHTNKPYNGKEKPTWSNGDMSYTGSGSAEWANWARAIISLQSTGTHGLYKMHAAKRGARLGWKDEVGDFIYEKFLSHSRTQGVICWHEATADDMPKVESNGHSGRDSVISKISSLNTHAFISACPPGGEGLREIARRLENWLSSIHRIDASRCTCQRAIIRLVETGKLSKNNAIYTPGPNR